MPSLRRALRSSACAALPVFLVVGACQRAPAPREYALIGQVISVDPPPFRGPGAPARHVTIRHQDIQGFMPGMTMPFAVKEARLLDGIAPGDLIEATLMVQDTTVWIARITKTGHRDLPPAGERPVSGLTIGDQVADLAFVDQDSRPMTLAWLDGHVSVVTFIYTRCPLPDFCPAIDRRFVAIQRAIQMTPGLSSTRLLSVSIDPAYDRPPVLKAHATTLGADPTIWRFATGSPTEIAAFGRQFGLDVQQTGEAAADVTHNLRTVVLDRDRRVVEMLTGSAWTASDLVTRLRTVAGA